MSQESSPANEPAYREAMAELARILREIESEEVDVDELAVKVERAAYLVRICRNRIEATEVRVRSILEDLEHPAAPDAED